MEKNIINGQLPEESSNGFLTLDGERIIIAKRKHVFVLLRSLSLTISSALLLLVLGSLFLRLIFPNESWLVGLYILFLIAVSNSLALKNIVDWYYHFYIITSRKILEICSRPPFFHRIDDVFLDQVRTTEVDSKISTILHEFLDMGDVIITFDRPSHEKGFVLSEIQNPREVCIFLGDSFEQLMHISPWFREESIEMKKSANFIRFNEDLFKGEIPLTN